MTSTNINRVVVTGNLTHDPELRSAPDGTAVCSLRIASNARRKDATSGEWADKPNYLDVTVFGAQGENAARYLDKGRGVAIDGHLDWREWQGRTAPSAKPSRSSPTPSSSSALRNTHPTTGLTTGRPAPPSPPTTTFRSDPTSQTGFRAKEHCAAGWAGTPKKLAAASAAATRKRKRVERPPATEFAWMRALVVSASTAAGVRRNAAACWFARPRDAGRTGSGARCLLGEAGGRVRWD